jgi:hypothetical protein
MARINTQIGFLIMSLTVKNQPMEFLKDSGNPSLPPRLESAVAWSEGTRTAQQGRLKDRRDFAGNLRKAVD